MGFMDKALERSERRLISDLIEGLRYLDLQESTPYIRSEGLKYHNLQGSMTDSRSYDSRSLTCAENPRYSHVALKVTGNGRQLFFHRCRNYWYFSTGTNGANYQLMDMIERFDPAMAGAELHQVIQSLLGVELVGDTDETSPSNTTRGTNSPDLPDELSLDSDTTYNLLLDLMIRSGSQDDLRTSQFADTLATNWETDTLDALAEGKDAQIGDLWLKESRTTNKRASRIIKDLNAELARLRSDGVCDEDIVNWWNIPVAKQNLFKAQANALLQSRIDVRLQALQRERLKNNIDQLALVQALCTVPTFGKSLAPYQDEIKPASPLPWELYTRVTSFFLSDVKQNPNWELEAIELRSYNAYFRSRHETHRS